MSIRDWAKRPDEALYHGLTEEQVNILATYNSERHRGLTHTPEWIEEMAQLKYTYDHTLLSEEGR